MKLRIQLTSIALLAVCAVGHAAEPGESVTVTLDNDVFTSSDNNYTNGLGVSWVSAEIQRYDEDRFVRKWARFWSFLPFVSDDGYDTYESWSLVQEMDTPDDIKNPNPPANDQPYAGILYVDAVLYAKNLVPSSERLTGSAAFRWIPVFSAAVIVCVGVLMTGKSIGVF